jgi:hypothetical protein
LFRELVDKFTLDLNQDFDVLKNEGHYSNFTSNIFHTSFILISTKKNHFCSFHSSHFSPQRQGRTLIFSPFVPNISFELPNTKHDCFEVAKAIPSSIFHNMPFHVGTTVIPPVILIGII